MKVDWLIVGAGLAGATFAEQIASQRGETVLVVDQRDHVGGNVYDEYNEHGILDHVYGPHIFHTNSREVWIYLSKFTQWRPYFHRVLASIDGELVPLPFNLNSIDHLFPRRTAKQLTEKLVSEFGFGTKVPIQKLQQAQDDDLRFLYDFIYKKVFESYTMKQWDLRPEQLSPSVTARVPVLVSRDNRYFHDTYQAVPARGYTAMIRNMLSHSNIRVLLNTKWADVKGQVRFNRMVFTGPIDQYFEYCHGELPYRSLFFERHTLSTTQYQSAPVINYPNEYDYTRVTELKYITGQAHSHTTVLYEYPQPHEHGDTIPYYPVPTDSNRDICSRYKIEAKKVNNEVIFVGRLAEYMYYNMDQIVASSLSKVRQLVAT